MTPNETKNLHLALNAMDDIVIWKDKPAVAKSFHDDFIQHNPWAKDGRAHVEEMCDFSFAWKPIRWVAQGDLVAHHCVYTAPNPLGNLPLVGADIWRIENGKIKEHWDALQQVPIEVARHMTNGGGQGEMDVMAERVEANIRNVRRLYDEVFNGGNTALLSDLIGDTYIQHHLGVPDGREALHGFLQHLGGLRNVVKRTIASGDLVFAHVHYQQEGFTNVTIDIFRLDAQSRIVEHWDVSQDIVPLEQAGNTHPHF